MKSRIEKRMAPEGVSRGHVRAVGRGVGGWGFLGPTLQPSQSEAGTLSDLGHTPALVWVRCGLGSAALCCIYGQIRAIDRPSGFRCAGRDRARFGREGVLGRHC